MAQPGEPDGERPDDGQHKRGLWSVSLFVGAFAIGTLLVQLFKLPELPTGPPSSPVCAGRRSWASLPH